MCVCVSVCVHACVRLCVWGGVRGGSSRSSSCPGCSRWPLCVLSVQGSVGCLSGLAAALGPSDPVLVHTDRVMGRGGPVRRGRDWGKCTGRPWHIQAQAQAGGREACSRPALPALAGLLHHLPLLQPSKCQLMHTRPISPLGAHHAVTGDVAPSGYELQQTFKDADDSGE